MIWVGWVEWEAWGRMSSNNIEMWRVGGALALGFAKKQERGF